MAYEGVSSTTNTILQSAGLSKLPTFSTATYPATTTANQILYSSSNNTIAGLATANSGVLATNSSGVPSIDTTNFAVLSTGLQLKGNNAATTPPAGFIGESISGSATSVSLSNATPTNITSISLTAGIWDVYGFAYIAPTGVNTLQAVAINTNSATISGNQGIDYSEGNFSLTGSGYCQTVPRVRATLGSTTTYYLVGQCNFSTGTCAANGRISATRVG